MNVCVGNFNYKNLINKINNLTRKEKTHILGILKKHNVDYTKNNNGYFINLNSIDSDILIKIDNCVELIESKRDLIYELDSKREKYLNDYKELIENKLKETVLNKKNTYFNKITLRPISDFIMKFKKLNKKVFSDDSYIDPDMLIKQYKQGKKITKAHPYFNLYSILNVRKKKEKETDISDTESVNSELESEHGDLDVDLDVEADVNEIEKIDTQICQSEDGDNDDNDNENENDNENDNDDENDNENDDDKSSNLKIKKKSQLTEKKLDYYKNLLKSKMNIEFNDDLYVKMIYQKYIE